MNKVALVLGVNRPFRVRGEVSNGHFGLPVGARTTRGARASDLVVAVQPMHVERRSVDGQVLAELLHPVMIEVKMLAAGEGVPRLEVIDVDGEGRIATAAMLEPDHSGEVMTSSAAPAHPER